MAFHLPECGSKAPYPSHYYLDNESDGLELIMVVSKRSLKLVFLLKLLALGILMKKLNAA